MPATPASIDPGRSQSWRSLDGDHAAAKRNGNPGFDNEVRRDHWIVHTSRKAVPGPPTRHPYPERSADSGCRAARGIGAFIAVEQVTVQCVVQSIQTATVAVQTPVQWSLGCGQP